MGALEDQLQHQQRFQPGQTVRWNEDALVLSEMQEEVASMIERTGRQFRIKDVQQTGCGLVFVIPDVPGCENVLCYSLYLDIVLH